MFLKNYSLSIVLALLFVGSWIGQGLTQYQEYKQEAQSHSQELNSQEFINSFFAATFENWQSEFLQLFTMVILTSFLIHKGSPQSKESTDKMEKSLRRIEKKIANL